MSLHPTFFLTLFLMVTVAMAQQPAPAPVTPPPSAQPPAPNPPGVPIPGAAPTTPAGAPGATPGAPGATPGTTPATRPWAKPLANAAGPQPGIPLGDNKIVEDIIEPKLSGNALAALYRQYTGRRVIVSAAASSAEFSFVQDANPKDPLTYAQAAELLKKAATIENFVFVPDGEDPNLDILTLATGGIRPTGRGVSVYNENDPLPEGDAVISYVMTLNFIKPAEAVNTFTQIIGTFGSYGSIAAVPNAAAVVITENTSLIRKLIDLKKEIDKPSGQVSTRFIKVQYADVTELAETLTELLNAQASSQKTAGVQRTDAPQMPFPQGGNPAAAAAAAAAAGASGEETPVQIMPEPRTNRIFAMGRPVDLLFVEGLVREFDIQTSDKTFLRRKLRFLAVSDFLPIASDALTRAFSASAEGARASAGGGGAAKPGGSGSGGGSSRQSTKPGSSSRTSSGAGSSRSFGSNSSGFGGNGSSFGGGGSSGGFGGSSGGGMGGSSSLSAPEVSSAPESVLVGRTLLVADNITNTIVAQGPPSGLEIIERLLDQIDVKPDQVMISTVIGLLTLHDGKEFGVNYLINSSDFKLGGGGGGFPVAGVDDATSSVFPALQEAALAGSGLRMFGQAGDLGVFVKALQAKTDFTVLSRPSIFTSNNQKGTISSGERIAIPTGSQSYGATTGTSTQIQYQDVVLKLEVIPLVNSNNEITMQIALLSDEQNGVQTIQGGAGNGNDLTVPKISTREILTTATVPNNKTIVLGGLITKRDNQDKSGIPILSDIPLIGKLFSSTTNNKDRSELMIFIQPSIVNNARSLDDVQINMDSRYKVAPDVHQFADGAEPVLPEIEVRGKNGAATPLLEPAPAAKSGNSILKPSIRPANRR